MGRRPTVPYDQLAIAYLRAVAAGKPPARALCEQFGLSRKAVEWRREWMGRTGWLPPGDPTIDGRAMGAYGARWQAEARLMLADKLKARQRAAVARQEALTPRPPRRPAAAPTPRPAVARERPRPAVALPRGRSTHYVLDQFI